MAEGAALFEGVAAELGEATTVLKAPGGTRKIAYVAGVPGGLLANYRALRASMWARVGWQQAGHSGQSLDHLLTLGNRLASPRFVAMMLLVQPLLGDILHPFAK